MPSLLCLGDQAFWVSNGVKDLLYEVTVEVARRESPVAHRRLTEDGRLIGCYGVSGMGFDLEAFIDAFGGRDAWRAAAATHWDAIEGLCETPQSLAIMTKVFVW
ncbi:MAG TPA: hypothetical protein VFA18_06630, partial [Gemmataceae bacterium]|nr:hypothetical protein [Gemmataceae bacterium]